MNMLWPIIVAVLTLALAYLVFYVAPVIFDYGKGFLKIVAVFLFVYVAAAAYVVHAMPSVEEIAPATPTNTNAPAVRSVQVPDVVVESDSLVR